MSKIATRRDRLRHCGWPDLWRIFFICAATLIACSAAGESVTLAWDASEGQDVIGYRIYCGFSSGERSSSLEVGPYLATVVSNLKPGGTYFFVVKAYNREGLESIPSNEVEYTVPSAANPSPTPGETPPPIDPRARLGRTHQLEVTP